MSRQTIEALPSQYVTALCHRQKEEKKYLRGPSHSETYRTCWPLLTGWPNEADATEDDGDGHEDDHDLGRVRGLSQAALTGLPVYPFSPPLS